MLNAADNNQSDTTQITLEELFGRSLSLALALKSLNPTSISITTSLKVRKETTKNQTLSKSSPLIVITGAQDNSSQTILQSQANLTGRRKNIKSTSLPLVLFIWIF